MDGETLPCRFCLRGRPPDGATLPVEISLSPLPTASESFVLAVIRDATKTGRPDDLLDLARGAVADQSHLTRDLLDRMAHHLFQVGLSLQAVADLPGNVARERLTKALDRLDDVIHEIRDYAFTSGGEGQGGGEDPAPLGTAACAGLDCPVI